MRFVLTDNLEPGMMLARDIYFGKEAYMLHKGMILTNTFIMRFKNAGYYGVYITDKFSADIEYEEAIDQKLFQKGVEAVESEDIGSLLDVATQLVRELTSKDNVGLDLYDLRSYDEYTYHHSVNVAIYSVVVGKRLGLSTEELNNLSIAALTHDLGKQKIPEKIINKPGKLTDEEYEKIKMHPKYSFDILYGDLSIPSVVRQAVLCHHENENGTGYPMGKSGDEIPFLAKILHAVDVYDALTSKRSYKDPYSSAETFEYLMGGKNILFDEKIVDALLMVIPMYMLGTEIELSNGEKALVVAHDSNPLRPVIKIFDSEKLVNLDSDKEYSEVFIVKSGLTVENRNQKVDKSNQTKWENKAGRETIMVVDDSYLTCMTARKVLEREYNVETFFSGLEALGYIQECGCPDLIIMDIEMPGMNGIDTIKMFQKNTNITAPIVFFTSTCDKDMVIKCKNLGAIDYILKPVKPVYLLERINIALGKSIEA